MNQEYSNRKFYERNDYMYYLFLKRFNSNTLIGLEIIIWTSSLKENFNLFNEYLNVSSNRGI